MMNVTLCICLIFTLLILDVDASNSLTTKAQAPPGVILPSAKLTGPRPPGTLLLNMLIKNEAEHLERTLPKWAKIIDYWIIGVDDANTDNSVDVIKKHLGHIPGEIVIVHFDGMGPTWSILVDVGIKKYPQATHGIIADADFMPMSDYLDKMELDIRCSKHMFTIYTQDHSNQRKMDWIYRNIPGAIVKRRTHQILEVPELPDQEVFQTLINLNVEEREGGYGDRSGDKHERYVKWLEKDLQEYPDDTRTLYYLGYAHYELFNAHKDNPQQYHWDQLKKGVDYFIRRTELNEGNAEERWFANLKLGEIHERFYKDWSKAEMFYKRCTKDDPERADAYFYLGQYHRLRNDHKSALPWLKIAATLAIPQRSLFQWMSLYECLSKLEYGRAVVGVGPDRDLAKEALPILKQARCVGADANNMGEINAMIDIVKKKMSGAPSDSNEKLFTIQKTLKFLLKYVENLEDYLSDAPSDVEDESLFQQLLAHMESMQSYVGKFKNTDFKQQNKLVSCHDYRSITTPYLRWYKLNKDDISNVLGNRKKFMDKWSTLISDMRFLCR